MNEIWNTIKVFYYKVITLLIEFFDIDIASTNSPIKDIEHFSNDMFFWGVFMVLFCIGTFMFLKSSYLKKIINFFEDRLFIISLCVWAAGVFIYSIGMYQQDMNLLVILPRAMIISMKMFLAQHEVSRVSAIFLGNEWYMTAFSLLHFFAAMISIIFLLKFAGFRFKSYLNLVRYSSMSDKKTAINIFWGTNNASFILAENIHKSDNDEKIMFINLDEADNTSTPKSIGLKQILDIGSLQSDDIARLEYMDALVENCHYDLSSLDISDMHTDVFHALHMKHLQHIVKESQIVRFFFLSDDEDKNILSALNLLKDKVVATSSNIKIYVHARRGSINEIYDHYSQYHAHNDMDAKLKVIDSSYLAVASLKRIPEYHPVNVIDIDPDTCVAKSNFSSLIIGFGETGQESFKFLYEFASFVDDKGNKTPFKCYVLDKDLEHTEGRIRRDMPAITEAELELIPAEINSTLFWNKIDTIIKELNYVMITTHSDTLGLSLAVDVYKHAIQRRNNDLNRFKIFVRCHDLDNLSRMKDVAEKLNQCNQGSGGEIIIFGDENHIYTYDMIISDVILNEAKQFNKVYQEKNGPSDKGPSRIWAETFNNASIEKRMAKSGNTRLHAIDDINRQIAQNLSNSLHKWTKLKQMGIIDNPEAYSHLVSVVNSRQEGHTTYELADEMWQIKLLNMAKCEHERWVALHKVMGYQRGNKTNIAMRQHSYICDWDELDEAAKSYDNNVVDTSIRIFYQEQNK